MVAPAVEPRSEFLCPGKNGIETSVAIAVDDTYEGEPIKVASMRDLLLLKIWAAAERPELTKRMRDQADVAELLTYNADKITSADIAYICQTLLTLGYTLEEATRYRRSIAWLNQTLDELDMPDRKSGEYPDR